jgi:hypothetical protein
MRRTTTIRLQDGVPDSWEQVVRRVFLDTAADNLFRDEIYQLGKIRLSGKISTFVHGLISCGKPIYHEKAGS